MYCTNCGNPVTPEAAYCPHCGCHRASTSTRRGSHLVPIAIMIALFLFGLLVYAASKIWGIELLGAPTDLACGIAYRISFIMQIA